MKKEIEFDNEEKELEATALIITSGENSKEAKAIEKRLVGKEISKLLNGEVEISGKRQSLMEFISEKYMNKFLKPDYEVTNQDMLTLRKLNGEEKKISESTKVVRTEKIDLTKNMLEKVRDGDK